MKNHFQQIIFFVVLYLSLSSQAVSSQQSKIGWIENVALGDDGFVVIAKIDTGADNSSINAVRPVVYNKQNDEWVKFTLIDGFGKKFHIDKPIEHRTHIKTKKHDLQERIVIKMNVCLGNIKKHVYVNLVDRSNFKYQMLIGRSYLAPDFLVDSSQKFTVDPHCE